MKIPKDDKVAFVHIHFENGCDVVELLGVIIFRCLIMVAGEVHSNNNEIKVMCFELDMVWYGMV